MGVIKATFIMHPEGEVYARPGTAVVFGSACATLFSLLSLVLTVWTGESNPLPLMLGTICLLLLLWSPNSFTPLHHAWKSTCKVLSQAAIVFVWVLYILPTGLFMQSRGKDPLNLRFEPEARTYWKPPHPSNNMQRSS